LDCQPGSHKRAGFAGVRALLLLDQRNIAVAGIFCGPEIFCSGGIGVIADIGRDDVISIGKIGFDVGDRRSAREQ
jgi:hypothetical protein